MFDEFGRYLRKKGKKANVIDRNIKTLIHFIEFLSNTKVPIEDVTTNQIDSYVETLENNKISSKGYLYTLMNYFKFADQTELRLFGKYKIDQSIQNK